MTQDNVWCLAVNQTVHHNFVTVNITKDKPVVTFVNFYYQVIPQWGFLIKFGMFNWLSVKMPTRLLGLNLWEKRNFWAKIQYNSFKCSATAAQRRYSRRSFYEMTASQTFPNTLLFLDEYCFIG